jgi:hypothetical protein
MAVHLYLLVTEKVEVVLQLLLQQHLQVVYLDMILVWIQTWTLNWLLL